MTKPLAALALLACLAACGMPAYVPAHAQSVEEAAAARLECKAISEGMTPAPQGGFVAASGSPKFVGATMGAYATASLIAAGVRHAHKVELYDDCMIAHGFRKAPPQ